jgi:hypothetical protein
MLYGPPDTVAVPRSASVAVILAGRQPLRCADLVEPVPPALQRRVFGFAS